MITLTVNDASHRFEEAVNVAQLISHLNLTNRRIAVERNGDIIPRSQYSSTQLDNGDKLEIVVAVGGG